MSPITQKWNRTTRSLMKLNLQFAIIVFVLEIAAYAGYTISGAFPVSPLSFALFYVLFPSVINLALYFCARLILLKKETDSLFLQYVPILSCVFMCFNTSFWHSSYLLCRALFLIPLFLTVIFTDKRMSRLITLLSLVLLFLSDVISSFSHSENGGAQTAERVFLILLELCLYLFAYASSVVIIGSIQKKNRKIEESMDIRNRLTEELMHDQLTGLYSHGTYEKQMLDFTAEADTNRTPLCMAIIDIDNFKTVNDTYGHAQGNIVLIALSELLMAHCTANEAVARYGGEEFVIFFPNTDVAVAFAKLDEMRKAFARLTFDFLPEGSHITFSTGLAAYPGEKYSNAFFFELADKALYEAKGSGKNCVRVQTI